MALFRKKSTETLIRDESPGYTFGVSAPCPSCGGPGYIEHTDFDHRYQVEHCKQCGHKWSLTFNAEGALVHMADETASEPSVRTIDLRDEPSELEDDPAHQMSAGEWLRRTS